MVFCLILWVSWISILSKCLYVSAGNEFPYRPGYSTTNLLKDDDAHDSLSFDDVNKGHSKSPTSVLYFSFDGQYTQPGKLPEIQSITNVENILNGISRKWDSNLFEPITFPLKPGNPVVDLTVTKPAVVKPQGSPLDTFSGMKPAPISLVGTGSYDPLANLKPSHTSTSWSMASPGLLSKQPANPGSEETHLSPFQYRYVSNGSSQKRIGSSKIPSLFEGASGRHTVDASSPGSGKPQPLPSMFKPSPNSVSFDTGSHFGQRNDLIGQDTVNSVLQRKLPMKNPFDSDQSGQSNFIDAGPPTDHASTMWETPFDGTENQVSNEWMIPFFKMVDNWNFDFPQMDFKPQKSVSSSKGSKVYQPVNSMRPQKRIINSKNAYKRGRFVLSKTTYTPDHQMQQIKDATVLRSSKRPTQSVKL